MIQLKRLPFLRRLLGVKKNSYSPTTRAHPIQKDEFEHTLYAPTPDVLPKMLQFAMNNWVYTAVSKLAETSASAHLQVYDRDDRTATHGDHPLLKLIGKFGKPNDVQDTFEFLEEHFVNLDIAGNSYWYWFGSGDQPEEVHLLDPSKIMIEPGKDRMVGKYIYGEFGRQIELHPDEITHFKRPNPFSRYYGMSALQALELMVVGDVHAMKWNKQFFSSDVFAPAGVFVVPPEVGDKELERIQDEMSAKYSSRRRTAVARVPAGGVSWFEAGLKQRDVDFSGGRVLTRQAVYEALGLPLGVMSDASTEAHATVSQRQLYESVVMRHIRTHSKLNSDVMPFYSHSDNRVIAFEEITQRATDWKRESLKLNSLKQFMTVNEIRSQFLNLSPIENGDSLNGNQSGNEESVSDAQGRFSDRDYQSEADDDDTSAERLQSNQGAE